MLNWESLQTACLSCTSCPLSQTRHNVVFGVGPQDAEVMFVGEGPGENEDLQGEPFVGAAGKFLDEMLSIIDLGRENCYITNIVKCRPPRNRDPMQTEQDACIGFLRAQTKENRVFFVRRYWYGESISEIAEACRCSEEKVKSSLFRTRNRLREAMKKEDIAI